MPHVALSQGATLQPRLRVRERMDARLSFTGNGIARNLTVAGHPIDGEFSSGAAIPLVSGPVEWTDEGGRHRVDIEIVESQEPTDLVRRVLSGFQRELFTAGPLASDASIASINVVHLETLEGILEAHAEDSLVDGIRESLFRVCQNPRPELRGEEVWVPLDRVRRVSSRTVSALARRGHYVGTALGRMLEPERLVTDLVDETFDRYENRFVATLIDRLSAKIERRLRDVNAIWVSFSRCWATLHRIEQLGQVHRKRRLARRLKRAVDHFSILAQQAADLKDSLRRQLSYLLAARVSPLYEAVRGSARIRGEVKPTNILVHDHYYGPLYDAWRTIDRDPDPEPWHLVFDDSDVGFADYVTSVLGRALHELGFSLSAGQVPSAATKNESATATLRGPRGWSCRISRESEVDIGVTWIREVVQPGRRSAKRVARTEETQWRIAARYRSLESEPCPSSWLSAIQKRSNVKTKTLYVFAQANESVTNVDDALAQVDPIGRSAPPMIEMSPLIFGSEDRIGTWILACTLRPELESGTSPDQCPSCRSGRTGGAPEDRRCRDCGAAWGWLACKRCSKRIPFMLPSRPQRERLAEISGSLESPWDSVEFLDGVIGRDRVCEMRHDDSNPGSFQFRCVCTARSRGARP